MTRKKITELAQKAGRNKKIPARYEEPILTALAAYPELERIRIRFNLADQHPVPYGTTPTVLSFFRRPKNRVYDITLLEEAKEPLQSALFKNLTEQMQTAVIAHELVHVLQFNARSRKEMIKLLLTYPFPSRKKKLEKGADIGAINHGFGEGLYAHAVYIRSIPGYLKKRPDINKYYLKPDEILELLKR
jgi:hypothetical protein